MIALDIILIGIFVFFVINGFAKGFVKSVAGFISNLLVLLLTYLFTPTFSAFLQKTFIYDRVKDIVADSLRLEDKIGDYIEKSATSAISDIDLQGIDLQTATKAIQGIELPQFFKDALISNNNPVIRQTLNATGFIDYIYSYITNIAINTIAALVLFAVFSIVIRIIVNMLNIFAKLPVLNAMNRTGGLVFGVLEGIIFVWIAIIVATFLAAFPIGGFNIYFAEFLDDSIVAKFFESTGTNMLLDMVMKMSQK